MKCSTDISSEQAVCIILNNQQYVHTIPHVQLIAWNDRRYWLDSSALLVEKALSSIVHIGDAEVAYTTKAVTVGHPRIHWTTHRLPQVLMEWLWWWEKEMPFLVAAACGVSPVGILIMAWSIWGIAQVASSQQFCVDSKLDKLVFEQYIVSMFWTISVQARFAILEACDCLSYTPHRGQYRWGRLCRRSPGWF